MVTVDMTLSLMHLLDCHSLLYINMMQLEEDIREDLKDLSDAFEAELQLSLQQTRGDIDTLLSVSSTRHPA